MAPQQSGSQQDDFLGPIWIAITVMIVCVIIWYYGHTYISAFIINMKMFELKLVSIFYPPAKEMIALLKETDPSSVQVGQLGQIAQTSGKYFAIPLGIILGVLGITTYGGSAISRYKKTLSMASLRNAESVNWPQITPVLKLDLLKENISKGPWAMALNPMEFAKKHKLILKDPVIDKEGFGDVPVAQVEHGKALRVFTLQLGGYWEGVDNLPKHTQALFAIFAARVNFDNDSAEKLIRQIALSTKSGNLNFSGTMELLRKYAHTPAVSKICQSHAYIMTVMASLLKSARENGVLPSADFIWLKPLDRPLWFMLNNVGRQTAFSEVAGPIAHWLAECEVKRPLFVPMVEEAAIGLENAVKEIAYHPEEQDSDTPGSNSESDEVKHG